MTHAPSAAPRLAPLLALLLALAGAWTPAAGITDREIARAERAWVRASGEILAQRLADGSWDAELDPALSGLIGSVDGELSTTLGDLAAKRAAAQSGWCRVIGCLLDSLALDERDTVAVTMTGSFPGIDLAVLLTLEAADQPYRCVSSLGASSYGANRADYNWPRVEAMLKDRGLLRQGSSCITPGGANDRLSNSLLEMQRVAEAELRRHDQSLHPGSLRQAIDLRREILGPPEHLSLLINVGGGHAVLGTTPFGRAASGGLLGDAERLLLTEETGEGIPGLLQQWFQLGLPTLHFTGIVELARAWGLPTEPTKAETPDTLRVDCSGHPSAPAGPDLHD